MPSATKVPMVDLGAQYRRIKPAIDAAIARVVESGRFINGEDCGLFEAEFAAWCGASGAVGVANGTDALTLALKAFGVGPEDEVITVSNTFIATGEAILLNGARPVFVDVDPHTFTMDPGRLEGAITPQTKLIVPVHLYGHPADMTAIMTIAKRHGIPVLEDAAQAHGAEIGGRRAGTLGDAACFSFYPGKNLGAFGDAGMVVANDREFLARLRQLANHGAGKAKYEHLVAGTNSRLDTLQAAVLRVKLASLDEWNSERRQRVTAYSRALADVPSVIRPSEAPGVTSAWHLYTIRLPRRDALQEKLAGLGIATAVHYPRPIHLQPAMALSGGRGGDLPVSERLCGEVLSLPLYPELPFEAIEEIAGEIRLFCAPGR